MKKKPNNDYLLVLVPTFIVVLAWIIFNIYRLSITSTINEQLSVQILPIEPTFDQTAIDTIRGRTQVQPKYIAPTPATTITPAPSQEGTNSNDQESISTITPIITQTPSPLPSVTPTGGTQ